MLVVPGAEAAIEGCVLQQQVARLAARPGILMSAQEGLGVGDKSAFDFPRQNRAALGVGWGRRSTPPEGPRREKKAVSSRHHWTVKPSCSVLSKVAGERWGGEY